MKKTIELLAPGGDVDSIKAAIVAGANAVYCGLDKFNARNRATNIRFDDLLGIIRLAHSYNCQVFLTVNIIIVESEIPSIIALLNRLINTKIDGIIVQDLGLFYILSTYFKALNIHASTQVTTHNEGQIMFLKQLKATRFNVSRELNSNEIEHLTKVAHKHEIGIEVFVHGSQCICFSGICYMSSVHGGNSGNRGRCSQPCRDQYETTPFGKNFPLNLKDNSAYTNIEELYRVGVDSIKIEGRIKKAHYVYTVVDAWRKQLDNLYSGNTINEQYSQLFSVFNRGFSNAYLTGTISKDMFIDNPRDNSAIHLSAISEVHFEKAKGTIYDERTEIIHKVEQKIQGLSIEKKAIVITISGEYDDLLKVSVKTAETSFDLFSEQKLSKTESQALSYEIFTSRFKQVDETEYYIEKIDIKNLQSDLFLPFKELTFLKRMILYHLNGSKEYIDPISVPLLQKAKKRSSTPTLYVLLSSEDDLHLLHDSSAIFFYQLPNCLRNDFDTLVSLFINNKALIPYFPSIIIGEDYNSAIDFIVKTQPQCIVTNNVGIAFEAYKRGIEWIAGPYLNIVNSFSLRCIQEQFNCSGAFISNELSKIQIKAIKKPENFDLYYSIYHPLQLMTSRQCLFHQVTGCEKNELDESCISSCEKLDSITNSKGVKFKLHKTRGNYHAMYDAIPFLNIDIIEDIPGLFTGFLIDITNINTCNSIDKTTLIELFTSLLNVELIVQNTIEQKLHPITSEQYKRGI